MNMSKRADSRTQEPRDVIGFTPLADILWIGLSKVSMNLSSERCLSAAEKRTNRFPSSTGADPAFLKSYRHGYCRLLLGPSSLSILHQFVIWAQLTLRSDSSSA